jgi:hypothetical protein
MLLGVLTSSCTEKQIDNRTIEQKLGLIKTNMQACIDVIINEKMAGLMSSDGQFLGGSSSTSLSGFSQTETFNVRPIGIATPVVGSLIPTTDLQYNLGSPTNRFRSLYIGPNTLDIGGTVIKTDPNTGSLAISAAPTDRYPNPVAILVTPQGGFSPVQTIGGEIPVGALDATVARSVTYLAFQGADSGFF